MVLSSQAPCMPPASAFLSLAELDGRALRIFGFLHNCIGSEAIVVQPILEIDLLTFWMTSGARLRLFPGTSPVGLTHNIQSVACNSNTEHS